MGKEKDETVYADKTKVILSGISTVADVEKRMQIVLEQKVIPVNYLWDQYKKNNPDYLNEAPSSNPLNPYEMNQKSYTPGQILTAVISDLSEGDYGVNYKYVCELIGVTADEMKDLLVDKKRLTKEQGAILSERFKLHPSAWEYECQK